MAATIRITLPNFNGFLEAGLAVGTDFGLPHSEKLPILFPGTVEDAISYAGAWAYDHYREKGDSLRNFYTAGAIAAVACGLCKNVGDRPDGDFTIVATPEPTVTTKAPEFTYSKEQLTKVITAMVATKVMWYLCNHHTGGSEITGYVAKTLAGKFEGVSLSEITTCIHTLGHWISTIYVLTVAGIPRLKEVTQAGPAPMLTLKLAEDAKLRFTACPAGTHKMALAYESAKRLVKSPLLRAFPDREDLLNIPRVYNVVRENRAEHHIGASYLTGNERAAYSDSDYDHYLGRLGGYMMTMYPRSTLMNSPHLAKERIESYPDYSPDFVSAVANYKRESQTRSTENMKKFLEENQTFADMDNDRYIDAYIEDFRRPRDQQ